MLRTMVRGKRCDIGLGGLKLVSLSDAREQAEKYRKIARNDGDPLAEKRRARLVVSTFEAAAETVHKEHAKAWKNGKHSDQWINTLKAYAFPAFGDRKVAGHSTLPVRSSAAGSGMRWCRARRPGMIPGCGTLHVTREARYFIASGLVAWAGTRRPCSIRSCVCAASSGCVIDALVMPQITSANTNATSLMIGERGAALVKA